MSDGFGILASMKFVVFVPALSVIVIATIVSEVCSAVAALERPPRQAERRSGEDRRTRLVLAKRIGSIDGLDRRKGDRRKENGRGELHAD